MTVLSLPLTAANSCWLSPARSRASRNNAALLTVSARTSTSLPRSRRCPLCMLICLSHGERASPHRRRRRRAAERPGQLGARAHPQRPHPARTARTLRPLSARDSRKLGRPTRSERVPPAPPAHFNLRRSPMSRGAAVIRRPGRRTVTWSIKFRDAEGRQVWETLGPEPEWGAARAQRELGKRLQDVERERWRKPERVTFAAFAERFERDYLPGRNLKPSTQIDYRLTIRRHLRPFFGQLDLTAIEPADVDAYIAEKTASLAPKTISNHLSLLGVMFKTARRWRLVAANPIEEIEPPRVEQGEMHVLTEAEIARLLAAYQELGAEDAEDADWWALARRLVQVALGTALRRGELLA